MDRGCKKCGVGVSGMENEYVLSGVWWGGVQREWDWLGVRE